MQTLELKQTFMRAIFWALALGVVPQGALATTTDSVAPQCEPACAYEEVMRIPALTTLRVPTVVEVPLEVVSGLDEAAVAVRPVGDINAWLPVFVTQERSTTRTPIQVFSTSDNHELPVLSDEVSVTSHTFPVRADLTGRVLLSLVTPTPVRVSALRLVLAENVEAPETIAISVRTDDGQEEVVLNPIAPTGGGLVRFPFTTAREFFVTLTYTQPLRVTEIELFETDPVTEVRSSVRFLAEPGEAYEVFTRPDRLVVVPYIGERPNLVRDEGVVVITSPPTQPNPRYVAADQDQDQVIDRLDNCPDEANPDQRDDDGNGVGDACDDFDRDGYRTVTDNCPNDPNPSQADEDGDGIGDACDEEESRFTEQYGFIPWLGIGLATLVLLGLMVLALRGSGADSARG